MTQFNYMSTLVEFAPPKPFQSGASWLWNRVATDIPLAVEGIGNGLDKVRKIATGVPTASAMEELKGLPTNISNVYKRRSGMLNNLDEKANNIAKQRQLMNSTPSNPLVDPTVQIPRPSYTKQQLQEMGTNMRNEIDGIPDRLTDKRYKYNYSEQPNPIDLRKYPYPRT